MSHAIIHLLHENRIYPQEHGRNDDDTHSELYCNKIIMKNSCIFSCEKGWKGKKCSINTPGDFFRGKNEILNV
jgi:hypothetical protein